MNLERLIDKYMKHGYDYEDAISKVCQDIILLKISKSRYKKNITIKGGVVIHNISSDLRRATRDMDLDFIKYSLEDESIEKFISELNSVDDGIILKIVGKIKELHHQDYKGKKVYIMLTDKHSNEIETKIDFGVHKYFDIEQDEYYFDLKLINDGANLLINSKEQIFTEKLKSLLKIGITSTRYKDILDFYYLINYQKIDKDKMLKYFDILIFQDKSLNINNLDDILERIKLILNDKNFKDNLSDVKVNWLNINSDDVISNVLNYINNLRLIAV